MPKTGVNNKLLKQKNRGLLLKLIATGACSSRIELAQKTGLSKMTVSNIVNEFLENDMLEELEKAEKMERKGRNPIQLRISPRAPKLIGVHLHREGCNVILCDLKLNIQKSFSFPVTSANAENLMEQILDAIGRMFAETDGERIWGISIAALGPSDILRGKILKPTNFCGIQDLNLKSEIEQRYHIPVYFDSESNGAAIVEKYYGNGNDCEDFIYVVLSNGVGSGLVVGGQLYTSSSGMTCEFGHVSIDWKGRRCNCGSRGCLETYISSTVLEEQMQRMTGETKNFREFCQEMEQALERKQNKGIEFTEKERQIDMVLRDMAEYLSCGIINFSNGLNPQRIIIGHDGYWIPDQYLRLAEKEANERLLTRKYRKLQVMKSYFRADGTVFGCAGALLTAVFDGKLFE